MDGPYVLFLLCSLTVVVLPTFAEICNEALGLVALKDSPKENLVTSLAQAEMQGVIQLDTSLNSFLSQKYWKTRLTEPISKEQNEIMQFDIGKPSLIRAIVAHGCGIETDCHHVTRYRLLYSVDNIQWHFYSTSYDEGNAVFIRDNDCSSSSRFDFHCPIIARYIRILPHSWRLPCNLMVKLIGCALESPKALVNDGQTSSQTYYLALRCAYGSDESEDGLKEESTEMPSEVTDIITSTEAEDSISTVKMTTSNLKTNQSKRDGKVTTESPGEMPFDSQNTTDIDTLSDSKGNSNTRFTSDNLKTTTIKVPSDSQSTFEVKTSPGSKITGKFKVPGDKTTVSTRVPLDSQSTFEVKTQFDSQTTVDARVPSDNKTNIKTLSDGESKIDEKIPYTRQTTTNVELPEKGTTDVKAPKTIKSTVKIEFTTRSNPSETTSNPDDITTVDRTNSSGMTGQVKDTSRQNEHTTEKNVSDEMSENLTTSNVQQNNTTTSTYLTSDDSSKSTSPSIDTLGRSNTKGIKETPPQPTDADNLVPPVGCVADCDSKPDGHYHSCKGCKVFVTCSNGNLYDNRPCPSSLIWDDHRKQCAYASQTCEVSGARQLSRS